MAVLSTKAVNDLMMACLSDGSEEVIVDGIVAKFSFSQAALDEHASEIRDLLAELPANFMEKGGGGWSFLQSCMDKDGNHWGEHPMMEALMCLGIAIGKVQYLIPRAMWKVMPGSMPYFYVKE